MIEVMKRILLYLLMFFLVPFSGLSQNENNIQQTIREKDTLYILEKGRKFKVNQETIMVRPKENAALFSNQFKVVNKSRYGYYDIAVPDGMDVEKFAVELYKSNMFDLIRYNSEIELYFEPNDPLKTNQWHIDKINLRNAWNITTGDSCIKVAIVDKGVNRDYQDIGYSENSNYTNISYSLGYDYYNNTQYASPEILHGTFVGSIIGAKTNNGSYGVGVTGGNNGPGVTMISYRVTGPSSIASAIDNAVENGARVINISLGFAYNENVDSALAYAYNHNVSIVCASGNEGLGTISYPACNLNTIAVGATTASDIRWTSSNYGNGLDLVAPGHHICVMGTPTNMPYYSNGTSFSAPMVSGTIALMLSVNPDLTPDIIRNILHVTATQINGYTYNSGWNNQVGYGLLNTYAAVKMAQDWYAAANSSLSGNSNVCNNSSFTLPGIPSNATVSWSYQGQTTHNPSLQPYNATCYVSTSYPFKGMLYATVQILGYTVATYSKEISGGNGFIGYYWDNTEYMDVVFSDENFATPGYIVTVQSDYFDGRTIRTSISSSPSNYTTLYPSNDRIQFVMPNLSDGQYLTLWVTGSCGDYSFKFYPRSSYRNLLQVTSLDKSHFILSLGWPKEGEESDDTSFDSVKNKCWLFRVYNTSNMQQVLTQLVEGNDFILDTSSWEQGVYIIRAYIGSKPYTTKITVK